MMAYIPSLLDGFRVDPTLFEQNPARTCYEEFQRQLKKTGNEGKADRPSLTDPSGRQINYLQLDEMINRLGTILQQHHCICAQRDKPVAVFLPPGFSRIAALLALNKLGVAFVPLDTVHANEQRKHIVEHSQAQAIILEADRVPLLKESNISEGQVRFIVIDSDCSVVIEHGEQPSNPLSEDCQSPISSDQTFLTLYTSGSTGAPKGILLTDANLLNRLRWQWAELPFSEDGSEVCLAKTNHLFVDSYTEILGSVLRLQRLVIVDPNAWRKTAGSSGDVAALIADAIEKHKVTRLILVPSLLRALLEVQDAPRRLASLRLVVSSGEALPAELARKFFQTLGASASQPRLGNFYGSTEVTGDVTAAIFASDADVATRTVDGFLSIGRPVHNTTVFVTKDDSLEPVPMGEIGHIYVSGANLCKGFAGEEHLFNRFFDKHPHFANVGAGQRLIAMDDLGRVVPGGEIFYCGRTDSIVKIRGNRVSTLSVEKALKEILQRIFEANPPKLGGQAPRCKVIAFEHRQSATFRLAAFYEHWPEAAKCLRADNVRLELANRVAQYAVPELMFPLEAGTFPLQPHTGKTDQRALKRIALEAVDKAVAKAESIFRTIKAKSGDIQVATEAVKEVAAMSLGLPSIDQVLMDASFMNQGGNSLSVIEAVSALHKIGYVNATAELLLTPNETLGEAAKVLSETLNGQHFSPEKSSSAADSFLPSWLELRNVADLTEEQTRLQ